MEKATAMYINALEYFASQFGPENCVLFDVGPTEANTVIAPQKFEEFVYPYTLQLHTRIRDLGFPGVLIHPCADQNQNIPYYVKLREELGWAGKYFWLFGPETPIADQIEAFGDHDVICGNVDPPSFQVKSYEEVFQLCKENLEAGKDSPSGFILSPGCEMPPNTPPVNLMAIVDAAEMHDRKAAGTETILAMGRLTAKLEARQKNLRQAFSERFERFASAKNKKRLKKLLAVGEPR